MVTRRRRDIVMRRLGGMVKRSAAMNGLRRLVTDLFG
jgi:hypothetical protein